MSLSGNISFPEWLKKNQRQVQNSLRASTPLLRTLNGVNDHSLIKPSMDFICPEHSGRFKFASSLLALPLMPRLSQDRWGTVTGAMPISSWILNHQHFFMTNDHRRASKCLRSRVALQPSWKASGSQDRLPSLLCTQSLLHYLRGALPKEPQQDVISSRVHPKRWLCTCRVNS